MNTLVVKMPLCPFEKKTQKVTHLIISLIVSCQDIAINVACNSLNQNLQVTRKQAFYFTSNKISDKPSK